MNVVELRKPFVPSIDRQRLATTLRLAQPSGVVSFGSLSESIGRDVLACRWLLDSARRTVRKDDGIVFEAVVGIGLRRLPNEEIPGRGPRAIARARRTVVRGAKDVKCAIYGELPEKARVQFNMTLSLSGALLLMTRPSRMKKLEQNATDRKFDPRETVRLFLGAKKD